MGKYDGQTIRDAETGHVRLYNDVRRERIAMVVLSKLLGDRGWADNHPAAAAERAAHCADALIAELDK